MAQSPAQWNMSVASMKIFLTLFLVSAYSMSSIAYAQPVTFVDVKLSCEISLTTTYSTDPTIKKETIFTIVDITQSGSKLVIVPTSDEMGSVSSGPHRDGTEVLNYSNANRWDLTVNRRNDKNELAITHIAIDRNTGQIFYTRNFHDKLYVTGNGNCSKVDVTKKKF